MNFLLALTLFGDAVKVGDGSQPQMAIAADGTIFVAYIKDGNIAVSVSTDRGKSFEDEVVVYDAGGRYKGGKQRGPRIGVDEKKNVYVTVPADREIFLVMSNDAGKTWSKPARVNEASKRAPEALHWLAVTPTGDVHIAWLDTRNEPGMALYYAKIAGGKVGPNVKIAQPVCQCCAPGIAADGKGNVTLVVREGEKKKSRDILIARSTDGGRTFGKPARLNKVDTNEDS